MNLFSILVASILLSFSAIAKEKKEDIKAARGVAGASGYSLEQAVAFVLQHSKLLAEKTANSNLASMNLKQIDVERGDGTFSVWLTYKFRNGGAPCNVKAVGKSVNTVPDGAAGVNIRPELVSIETVCAQ